jgi:hypothetical protein
MLLVPRLCAIQIDNTLSRLLSSSSIGHRVDHRAAHPNVRTGCGTPVFQPPKCLWYRFRLSAASEQGGTFSPPTPSEERSGTPARPHRGGVAPQQVNPSVNPAIWNRDKALLAALARACEGRKTESGFTTLVRVRYANEAIMAARACCD